MAASSVRKMALSREPPRMRPMARRGSISDSKQKVRARDRTWRKDSRLTSSSTCCWPTKEWGKATEPGLVEELEEGLGGTVEDGDFYVVEVDEDVVDAVGVGGGEKMLGGGEQDALLHEAGGVADARDV